MVIDRYSGHICVAEEPGCTCATHADALRERDRLHVENERLRAENTRLNGILRGAIEVIGQTVDLGSDE